MLLYNSKGRTLVPESRGKFSTVSVVHRDSGMIVPFSLGDFGEIVIESNDPSITEDTCIVTLVDGAIPTRGRKRSIQ